MSSPIRDSQRKRVYDAERAAFPKLPSEGLTVSECQALVDKWRAGAEVVKRYPRARFSFKVTDGRSRRNACFEPSRHPWFDDDGYWHGELKMPRWSRSRVVLLHELAHALTHVPNVAWHGWEFCECYLYLVRVYLGRGAAEKLEREFKAHKVRYKPPRTRTMTDEQREAARQRMLAYHRDRDQVAA